MLIKHSWLLFSLFLFSCSTTPISRFDSAKINSDSFGIVHAARTQTQEEYILLQDLGAVWVSNTFSWYKVEIERNLFDFSDYDNFVNNAKTQNKKIAIVLGFQVPWLFPDGIARRYVSNENIPAFLNYVENTVAHFKGRVDVWSIWNEPNWNRFWKGTDSEFYELSRLAAEKIKEVDPDAYVIGGVFWRTPKNFIKKMHMAGALENLDGIAFHPYAASPAGAIKLYDKFLDILQEINFDKPVWVTEMGYPTGGWYITKVSLKKQPSYIVKTIAGFTARGVRTILWYELYDDFNNGEISRNTNSSEKFFGLVYPNNELKAGAHAFALCAQYLPGSRYEKNLLIREQIPNNIVSFCYLEGKRGFNTLILWNDRNSAFKAVLEIQSAAFLHNISTGEKTEILSGTVLDIRSTPLFITWQGNYVPQLIKV